MSTLVILLFLYQLGRVQAQCTGSGCKPSRCYYHSQYRYWYCEECKDGYFLKQNQCFACYEFCLKCSSDYDCSRCKPYHYGSYCQLNCSGCEQGQCQKTTGACLTHCQNGYYINTEDKCVSCRRECTSCTGNNNCSNCISGYYLSMYAHSGICLLCPRECIECTDLNFCSKCHPNYWGTACQYTCNDCLGTCYKDSGCSECKNEFYRQYSYAQKGYTCLGCPSSCLRCTSSTYCQSCISGTWGDHCQNTCNGCKNNLCDIQSGCSSGCSDGYFLERYESRFHCKECPMNCKTCENEDTCSLCRWGYSGDRCQHDCRKCDGQLCDENTGFCKFNCTSLQFFAGALIGCQHCPDGCTKCTSAQHCKSCVTGRWGNICQSSCNNNCKNNSCYKTYGSCINGCTEGYFGTYCSSSCLPGCKTCSIGTNCINCKKDYFHRDSNHKCDCSKKQCSEKDGDTCLRCLEQGWYPKLDGCCPCSDSCLNNTCFQNGTCVNCIDGTYGDTCEHPCSWRCYGNMCHRDGSCTACTNGKFGSTCNIFCRRTISSCDRCYGQDRSSVICTHCFNNAYAEGKTCKPCSLHCLYSTCDGANGHCTHGCHRHWFGDKCDTQCNISNCHRCPHDPNLCEECKDGYYSRTNLTCIKCPANCEVETLCNKFDGSCRDGCLHGWSGEQCNFRCPDGCKTCDQANASLCRLCKDNLFGYKCELNCSSNCNSTLNEPLCDISNGYCTNGCTDKYWGDICDKNCGIGCNDSTCDRFNGRCISGCNIGYYGSLCDLKCSGNCAAMDDSFQERTCDEVTGTCSYGCTDGFYGNTCNSLCSKQCNGTVCDRRNETCLFGCIDGYTGSKCNKAKSSTLEDSSGAVAVGAGTGIGVAIIIVVVTVIVVFVLRRR